MNPLSSFSVENRTFAFQTDPKDSLLFRLIDSSFGKIFSIALNRELLTWFQECFERLCKIPLTQKFYIETRIQDSHFWIEKLSSKKGHFVEVAKNDGHGTNSRIIIPKGCDKSGWLGFLNSLSVFISVTNKPSPSSKLPKLTIHPSSLRTASSSYKDKLCNRHLPPSSSTFPTEDQPSLRSDTLLSSSSIIIHRKFFHHSWKAIESALRRDYSSSLTLTPFQPDKALMACIDSNQATILTNIKDWYNVSSLWVRFSPVSPEILRAPTFVPSYGGWIMVRDIPIDRWNLESFKLIGDSCGGYLHTAKKTTIFTDLLIAHIKVKQNPFGFLPASILLPPSKTFPSSVVWIEPFFSHGTTVGYKKEIHGFIPPSIVDTQTEPCWNEGILGSAPASPRSVCEAHADVVPVAELSSLARRPLCQENTKPDPCQIASNIQLHSAPGTTVTSSVLTQKPLITIVEASKSSPLSSTSLSIGTSHCPLANSSSHPIILGDTQFERLELGDGLSPINPILPLPPFTDLIHTTLPLSILDEFSPFFTHLSTSSHPSIKKPRPHEPSKKNSFHPPSPKAGKNRGSSASNQMANSKKDVPLKIADEVILIDGKTSTLTKGTIHSTNTPFSFSDSEDYGSSPCSLTPPASPISEKALVLHKMDSFPNLDDFFTSATVFDMDHNVRPLKIAQPLSGMNGFTLDLLQGDQNRDNIGNESSALVVLSETPESTYEDELTEIEEEDTPAIDPASLLPILIPWLAKIGLCISALPKPKKKIASKKKAKGTRELVNLYSSIQYEKTSNKASSSHRLGSSSGHF